MTTLPSHIATHRRGPFRTRRRPRSGRARGTNPRIDDRCRESGFGVGAAQVRESRLWLPEVPTRAVQTMWANAAKVQDTLIETRPHRSPDYTTKISKTRAFTGSRTRQTTDDGSPSELQRPADSSPPSRKNSRLTATLTSLLPGRSTSSSCFRGQGLCESIRARGGNEKERHDSSGRQARRRDRRDRHNRVRGDRDASVAPLWTRAARRHSQRAGLAAGRVHAELRRRRAASHRSGGTSVRDAGIRTTPRAG